MLKRFARWMRERICSNQTRLLIVASVAILVGVAFTLASVAANDAFRPRLNHTQSSRTTSTHAQANRTYTLNSALWRTDGSFVSTIRIKNVLVVASMDVTPVIFMQDGTAYPLRMIHIPVSGVATVNINDALAATPASISSHVSEFGSAALIYTYPSPGHVTAQMAAIDAARSLSYTYPFVEPMNMQHDSSKQVLEGLWWKHDRGVRGFVSVSNSADVTHTVKLRSIGLHDDRQDSDWKEVELAAHSTRMLSLEELGARVAEDGNHAGGIRVEYEGSQGAILVTGGLANESEGYSANMPFWFHDTTSSSPTQITYASAGLMLGKPDPMMMPGFPKETVFSAYLSIRNTTQKPLDVALQVNYMSGMGMEGSTPATRTLPAQHLAPFDAKQVDMQRLLDAAGLKNFSGSVNLSTSFTGQAGDLLLATGSVDQKGTYVFEVEPQGIGSSHSKYANYWGVANGSDTMFTLWNPTNEPQDILATFYYGNGSGKYNLPVHVGPQASTMIDMAMLIAEIKPDADGNVIPPSIQEGSAVFASSKGTKEQITLVIAGGIYNVTAATCGGICVNCCGETVNIFPNPIFCVIGETMPCYGQGTDCYGSVGNYPGTWSSSNTSVMTVDSSGNVTGHAVGTATITWISSLFLVDYTGQYCYSDSGTCPSNQPQTSAPATVQKPGYLQVVSSPNDTTVCLGLGCATNIKYRVLDTNRNPMNISGMTVAESVSVNSNTTCSGGLADSGVWTTDSTGTMTQPDQIYWCCSGQANQNCRISWNQYFTVNGQSVLIRSADGNTNGIKNTITINCTNGQASCAGILIN